MAPNPEYVEYLQSDAWYTFRRRVIRFRGNRCQNCGADGMTTILHVHHLNYERLGKERIKDVRLLCVTCHRRADRVRKRGTWKGKRVHVRS